MFVLSIEGPDYEGYCHWRANRVNNKTHHKIIGAYTTIQKARKIAKTPSKWPENLSNGYVSMGTSKNIIIITNTDTQEIERIL